MKEICELRINNKFSDLIPSTIIGNDIGPVTIVKIEKGSSEYQLFREISENVKAKRTESFFYGWGIKRSYSKKELIKADLFHLIISNYFEPAGEEWGTIYDETTACEICGANRKQISPLFLKQGSIPQKDIAITIAGEVVVSEKFARVCRQRGLKGLVLEPVYFMKRLSNYYQLKALFEINLSPKTIAGINPFDLTESSEGLEFTIPGGYDIKFEKEIYKCPNGHTIGLNLLSEVHAISNEIISDYDFFVSKQKIGVRRGLLRPNPLYFCSSKFRKIIIDEKLTGFSFEVAHVEKD